MTVPRAPWRRMWWLFVAIPLITLAGMYVWLAIYHGTPLLGGVIVHESGRYSLWHTIFYFSHFLREVPVVGAVALWPVAAVSAFTVSGSTARLSRRTALRCGLGAALMLIAAIGVVVSEAGWESARLDLFQFRTRDDEIGRGSHWHYHALSTIWLGLVAAPLLHAAAALTGVRLLRFRSGAPRREWYPALAWFALATLTFGVSSLSWMSSRYAGHQAREILTHALVSVPIALATGLAIIRPELPLDDRALWTRLGAAVREHIWAWAAVLLLGAFLTGRSLAGDIREDGQVGGGVPGMVAAHFFEHSLDYVFTVLVAAAATGILVRGDGLARIGVARVADDAAPPDEQAR